MIFNRALGEADLHGIYRGHYRSGSRSGSNTVRASHSLENNIDGSAITAHKSAYAGVSDKLISHIDSLVGYWALDGDATDSSGNGLDGTAANAEWVAGVYGLGIAFDGDDGITVPVAQIDAITIDSVTMAAWVKAEAGGRTGATFESTEGQIMNREKSYEMALRSGTGELRAAFGTGGRGTNMPFAQGCWAWYGHRIIPVSAATAGLDCDCCRADCRLLLRTGA